MGRDVAQIDRFSPRSKVADAIGLVGCVLVIIPSFTSVLAVTDPSGAPVPDSLGPLSCSALVNCDAGGPTFWRPPSAVGWIALAGAVILALLMGIRGLRLRSAAAVRLLTWVELLLALLLALSILAILGYEPLLGRRVVSFQEWNYEIVVHPQWTGALVPFGLGALVIAALRRVNTRDLVAALQG